MTEPTTADDAAMTPERLAILATVADDLGKIGQWAVTLENGRPFVSPPVAIAAGALPELLAEVGRLTRETEKLFIDWQTERSRRETAEDAFNEVRDGRAKVRRRLEAVERERDQARARVAELEGELADSEDRAQGHKDAYDHLRERYARMVGSWHPEDADASAPDRAERNNSDRRAKNGPADESAGPPADQGESGGARAECLLSESPYAHRCPCCGEPFHWIECPTGGWWAHDVHPDDDHDAAAGGPVETDRAEGNET